MRKLIFLLIYVVTLSAYGQIEYNENGKLVIGTNPTTAWEANNPNSVDTTTTVKIFGKGDHGSSARLTFGDQASKWAYNVVIGEQGDTDTDKLWLHGKLGLAYTMGISTPDTLFAYDVNKGNYMQFNCDVRSTGVFVASDSRFKENIEPVENSLDGLKSLSAVTYNLKPRFGITNQGGARKMQAQGGEEDVKSQRDKELFGKFYAELENEPARYGFIAQEVKEIYPELVRTDADGYMYVDYLGLVPLLVNAVNELQAKIEILESGNVSTIKSTKRTQIETGVINELIEPKLYQNTPNPFSVSTVIRYALPATVADATLYVYDLQGKQIKSIKVEERGEASITLQGSELKPGMYIYALIADGEEIASRRMILTE